MEQTNKKPYVAPVTLVWQKCIKPTITGATPTLVNYDFNLSDVDVNVTIGGNSEGYRFVLQHGGTITRTTSRHPWMAVLSSISMSTRRNILRLS